MSVSNEEEMPPGILMNRERAGSMDTQSNNSKLGKQKVMGDIGNPPRGIFLQRVEDQDEEDEDFGPSSYHSINPLTTDTGNVEMDTIRNSYRDDEEECLDSDIATSVESSPIPKRTSVFSGHEHEDTDDFLLSIMLAIRTAVLAGTRDANKQQIAPEDYQATRKHRISMAGDRKVEVKDYSPVIFTLLRRKFGISIPAYLLSWSDHRLVKSRSEGKSESMFVHSPDNKFVMKTLGKSEAKRLRKMLQPYYEHMTSNMDTFLSRIYGLHRMSRRRGQSKIYFAIFNNVFDTSYRLSEIYDLKGSTVGRRASGAIEQPQRRSSTSFDFRQIQKAAEEPAKKPTVLKDLDFTRKLHVGGEGRKKVLAQLAADCKFLASHQLMDYSLLIGVRRSDALLSGSPAPPGNATDSPSLSRSAVTPSSSPDVHRGTTQNPMPISSPRSRHSFVIPSTISAGARERVPGLLFFLESTKAATKSLREPKKSRRKSISMGKPTFTPPDELNSIDEEGRASNNDPDSSTNTPIHSPPPHKTDNNSDDASPTPSTINSPTKNDQSKIDDATKDTTDTTKQVTPSDTSTANTTTTTTTNVPPGTITSATNNTPSSSPPPPIHVTPASPPVTGADDTGNSGEVGKAGSITKTATTAVTPPPTDSNTTTPTTSSTTIPTDAVENAQANGNGHVVHNEKGDESIDNSSKNHGNFEDGSPVEKKPTNLGLLTVNSVPSFNYFGSHGVQMSKSGSVLAVPNRYSSNSANSSPNVIKKPNRSASLSYLSLDPLCENPHTPFFKVDDGGMKGTSFAPLDPKKGYTEIYYIGIIDFLQKFNKKKKLAGLAKSLKYEKEGLSTVDPVFYMERFMKMTERAIAE